MTDYVLHADPLVLDTELEPPERVRVEAGTRCPYCNEMEFHDLAVLHPHLSRAAPAALTE